MPSPFVGEGEIVIEKIGARHDISVADGIPMKEDSGLEGNECEAANSCRGSNAQDTKEGNFELVDGEPAESQLSGAGEEVEIDGLDIIEPRHISQMAHQTLASSISRKTGRKTNKQKWQEKVTAI
ncbi:hypothetical protein SUGI_0665560 [Cryptomeria japonica]|nr:hypothetical protein SUGI_0665560 [Cryptomeria japonica]